MTRDLLNLDWHSLTDPYNRAFEVPDLLRNLRSADARSRAYAERQLRLHLAHQGSRYDVSAAAVPFLIDLLADVAAPDRLAAYRLLHLVMSCDDIGESHVREAGPTLAELEDQRSDWRLARSPEWQKHGGFQRPAADVCQVRAYEAVRAGVPIYLKLLSTSDRCLRLAMAHLLAGYPQERLAISPVFAELLPAEQDPAVAATMCVTAGLAGDPNHHGLVDAVARRRDAPDRLVHRSAVMGLAWLLATPDTALVEELCDCLFEPAEPVSDWPVFDGDIATGAWRALGDLAVSSVPQLAGILLDRLRLPDPDRFDFMPLRLLLSALFPDGPLPDFATFAELTNDQRAAVRLVLDKGLLRQHVLYVRAIGECNVPNEEEALRAWCTAARS